MTPGASRPLAGVALVLAIALSIATGMAPQVSAGTLPPPSVFRISPSRALPGAKVEIGGAGLSGVIAVMFGGEPAAGFTVRSDSRVSALVPPGSGTVGVIVITRDGISAPTAADAFSYPGGPGRGAASVFAATPGVATSRRVTLTLTPGPLGVKTGAYPGRDLRAQLLGRWCPLTVRHGRPMVALACGLDAFSPATYIWNEARRNATFYAGDNTLKVTADSTRAVLTRAGAAATRIALVAPPLIDPRPAPTLMAPLSLLATAVGGTAAWDPATRTARVTATIADAGYARAAALLGSLPPYPGSTPSSAAMHGLPEGIPMAPYLRDASGEWRAPAPLPAVAAWIGTTARRLGYVGGGSGVNACAHGVCSETRYSGLFRLSAGAGFLPSMQVALGAVGRSATLVRYDTLVADTPTRPAPDPVPAGADGVTVATVLGDGSLANSRTVTDPAAVAALSALVDVLPLSTDGPINPGGPLITANTPTEVRLTFPLPLPGRAYGHRT